MLFILLIMKYCLKRLAVSGVHSDTVLWFRNYLMGQTHQTTAGEVVSSSEELTCNVEQGSPLGP